MNKLSDETLKKKYEDLHNNFIKGDFKKVIINYFLIYYVSPIKKLEKLKNQLML